jgi:hypothetical protein
MPKTKPTAPKIMIIRHAEKPPEPPKQPPPFGVTADGVQDKESLIVRGWQRAGALASFFAPPPGAPLPNPALATPQYVYSAKIEGGAAPAAKGKKKVGSKSERPQETITPLVDKLGAAVTTDYTFDKGDEKELAAAAVSRDGVVLICWQHQSITAITEHLPVSHKTPVPGQWPAPGGHSRFDVVWVFDLNAKGDKYKYQQIPQCLLAGDSPD